MARRPSRPTRSPKPPLGKPPVGSGVARTRRHAASAPRLAIVISRYNESITSHLLEGALGEYERSGGDRNAVTIIDAPGAFEIVALANAAARSGRIEAVVALGCIIKGETIHDRVLADAVTQGLVNITIVTGVPIGLGVLTVDSVAQARARAGGDKGNKGAEATSAVLAALAGLQRIAASTASATTKFAGASSRLVRPDKAGRHADRGLRRARRGRGPRRGPDGTGQGGTGGGTGGGKS